MDELHLKYQKLAQEYAKLKAQNQVLKRAVVEEKDNQASMKELLRGKEQLLRRSEQEMDSLVFRNQQMERRVELLQEELEKMANSKQKKKTKADTTNHPSHSNALNEDLRNKIRENEILHKQVYEADSKTRQLERQLTDELTLAKQEAKQSKEALATGETKYKLVVDKLQEERALLELQLRTTQENEQQAQILADQSSEKLAKIESELGKEVKYLSQVVQDTIVFNDCMSPSLSVLNVPPHDRRSQAKASELLKDAQTLISELCTALMNLHTYTEQRSKIYPVDSSFNPLSIVNQRLCHFLRDNASMVRPIGDSFNKFCDTSTVSGSCPITLHTALGLEPFAEAFRNYVSYLGKIMPYQVQSIEEECNAAVSAQTLQNKNAEFRHLYQRLAPSFTKLQTYLTLIASSSGGSHLLPPYNERAVFQKLLLTLNEMHLLFKDMSKAFNGKVASEHQLPTASASLKSTDEFLLSAFLSLSTVMAKLAAFISENTEFFTRKSPYRTRGISLISSETPAADSTPPAASPVVIGLSQRSVGYLSKVNPAAPPPSVPYKTAIQDHATALSSAESKDNLVSRLQESSDRINKLEQEKEHWLLEAQLLQMKLDKEKQKSASLQTKLPSDSISDNLANAVAPPSNDSEPRVRNISESLKPLDTSMLGEVSSITEPITDEDVTDSREEIIKQHLTSRLTEMSTKLQQSESKTLSFHAECQSLHKRLDLAEQKREKIQEEYNKGNQKISQLQDELAVTRKNYEDQLSLMSDHLAAMNDKLSSQKDEIENLKLNPKSKKSRLKVPGLG
uniref:protein phosphatase 1 regulatory subunit 21-like n=1 Tax=Styela clava TaxID=7725 RepID=UPI00193AA1EC|nr:protein phosphatase 1 regulatory subunit 21-like [Styela clava]